MFDPENISRLKLEIEGVIKSDKKMLERLREDIRPLKSETRRIMPRGTTAISFVGTDGGHNQLQFDPFFMQLVRVVDSSNNEYSLEVITPTTNVRHLSRNQFDLDNKPLTPLGSMMHYLGVESLTQLSPMIRFNDEDRPVSPSWVSVYRELVEWAVLFRLIRDKDYGTDTLIIFDGLLRSKVFTGDLFNRLQRGMKEGIENHARKNRKVYVVGLAKKSKVLNRYRLVMKLEDVMTQGYPCYVEVPRDLEIKTYVWDEYARGDDLQIEGKNEINKFVAGKMFFVKFGNKSGDPIWPVDVFLHQASDCQVILGSMLADARDGFPVPLYPRCLQKAHENASIVDFDMDIIQDSVFSGIRSVLGTQSTVLDAFRLEDPQLARERYR